MIIGNSYGLGCKNFGRPLIWKKKEWREVSLFHVFLHFLIILDLFYHLFTSIYKRGGAKSLGNIWQESTKVIFEISAYLQFVLLSNKLEYSYQAMSDELYWDYHYNQYCHWGYIPTLIWGECSNGKKVIYRCVSFLCACWA